MNIKIYLLPITLTLEKQLISVYLHIASNLTMTKLKEVRNFYSVKVL